MMEAAVDFRSVVGDWPPPLSSSDSSTRVLPVHLAPPSDVTGLKVPANVPVRPPEVVGRPEEVVGAKSQPRLEKKFYDAGLKGNSRVQSSMRESLLLGGLPSSPVAVDGRSKLNPPLRLANLCGESRPPVTLLPSLESAVCGRLVPREKA